MHRSRKWPVIAGTALATMALTFSSIGVIAQDEAVGGVPATPTGYVELDQALTETKDDGSPIFGGTNVSVQVQWNSAELDDFEATVAAFEEATGIDIDIQSIGRNHEILLRTAVLAGTPPDIAQIAQPAAMRQYAAEEALVDMTEWLDTERFRADFGTGAVGYVDGKLVGIPYKADIKSTVYYPKQAFEAAGYEVPTTWDELVALGEQIIADGNGSPWCISMEHGGVTGWVGTDWIEDVLLRTVPPETYWAWTAGELPFDSPEVRNAFDLVGQIWFAENSAYGGPTYINSTWVGQTMDPMFGEDGTATSPQCWMHKQALWYGPGFWPDFRANSATDPDYQTPYALGDVIDVFYFPPIDEAYGRPVLYAGDTFMVFDDRPEVRAVAQFFATPEGLQGWIQRKGVTSSNLNTPAEWYEGSFNTEKAAEIIGNSTGLMFDGGDIMPVPVGSGSFWTGMVDWTAAGGTNTDEVLASIDAAWPADEAE